MRRRSTTDRIFWGLGFLAFAIIIAPSISVIISVFHQAWGSLSWHLLTTPTEGTGGGLENAILGTLLLLLGVLVIAGTIGVSAGIFLAEYSTGRFGRVLRFLSEVLAGMPSIVIGYVAYTALVIGLHWKPSLLAGFLALSVLVLPYIVKTTEVSMRAVPRALREASAGLGISRSRSVFRIIFPPAVPGIISGVIVALAISTGETAPLLYTVGFLDAKNPSFHLIGTQVPYLTYVTYNDVQQPGKLPHQLAAAAGAVTLVILLILIALGRILAARSRRQTARMAL
jgi:phosphate transport system permease protein